MRHGDQRSDRGPEDPLNRGGKSPKVGNLHSGQWFHGRENGEKRPGLEFYPCENKCVVRPQAACLENLFITEAGPLQVVYLVSRLRKALPMTDDRDRWPVCSSG